MVPSAEQSWPGGLRMFAGCMPHNCLVTAALVTDSDAGQIKTAALISPDLPKLTIFHATRHAWRKDLTDPLVRWASATIEANGISKPLRVEFTYLH